MKRRPSKSLEGVPFSKRYRSSSGAMVPRAHTYRRKRSAAVQRALGVELKTFDTVKTGNSIVAAWAGAEADPAAGCLGVPTQGNGNSNRDGTKIVVKSLQVQGYLYRGLASDQNDVRYPALVQVSLVMDTQSNGAQLNAEDVYVDTSPIVPARRVIANTSRFKVLRTETFCIQDSIAFNDGAATGSLSSNMYQFNWYVKMNQVMNFVNSAGGGTVADIKDVSFHVIAGGTTYSTTVTMDYNFRMRFIG